MSHEISNVAEAETLVERLDPDALAPESACGRVPVRGLLAVAKRRGMAIARLDLRNSGRHRRAAPTGGRLWQLGALRAPMLKLTPQC